MPAGRPKGSKKSPIVNVEPSRCPTCRSTRRSEYGGTTSANISGMRENGTIYNRVIWRRCKCLDCDQSRVDRSYEYEPEVGSGVN